MDTHAELLWIDPLDSEKCLLAEPLLSTELEISLKTTLIDCRSSGPNLRTSKYFCSLFYSIESKAFSESRNTAAPGTFFCLVNDIISEIILMHSPICLPLM